MAFLRPIRAWSAASAVVAVVACGGGHGASGPTAASVPTPPAPALARFVDGLDHDQAIAGLVVAVDGVALGQPTGADGRTATTISNAARVATSGRRDFLDRDTRFAVTAPTLALWPLTPTHGAEYVRALVYDYSGGDSASTEWDYLMRPRAGAYTVSMDATFKDDAVAHYWVNVAVAEAMRITHGSVTFSWVESSGDVTFEVNASYPDLGDARGLCDTRFGGLFIAGARIVVRGVREARSNTVVHELGHFLGLQHSTDLRDVMSVRARNYQQVEFTPGEESAWLMMVQREPGNRFPDRDRALAAAGGRRTPPPIVCRR